VRTPITLFCLSLVMMLAFATLGFADYTLVGKIPAPQPCPGTCPVTGLAGAGDNLFATVVYDATSYLYLIRPSDGLILDSYAWDINYGGLYDPYFEGAAHAGGVIYWVADAANAMFVKFEFDDASAYVHTVVSNDRITAPTGLLWQEMILGNFDALWVTDPEADSLYLMQEDGLILDARPLSGVTSGYSLNPTSVAKSGENLFFTSGNFTDSLFEASQSAERVGAYYLSDVGGMDLYGAAFHNGLLYVAGYGDSILIYEPGTYRDPLPVGDSVVVHVIPDELDVGFTHVGEAGSLYVEVTPTQACPPPEDVSFFGDFYDISTTATFDYITKVALTSQGDFRPGVNSNNVRVFVRPSGECTTWRDITVEMIEIENPRSPVLARSGKRLSEDDAFSVFTFGEDNRHVSDVIALKFDYLDSTITRNRSSIPSSAYTQMSDLLESARRAFGNRRYELAAMRADRIADIAIGDAGIPHTYDPALPQVVNVAGRIASRAHTLSFSLRLLVREDQLGNPVDPTSKEPAINIIGGSQAGLLAVPNPSQSEFIISFDAPEGNGVTLRVYSVGGELVKTLADLNRSSGRQSLTWDGRNDQGMPVAAGTYFAVLEGGGRRWVRKMVIQR